VVINNYLFSIGGWRNTASNDKGVTAIVCASGPCADPPAVSWAAGDSGATLSFGRYRGALVYAGGKFFFTGGQSDNTTVQSTVDLVGYSN